MYLVDNDNKVLTIRQGVGQMDRPLDNESKEVEHQYVSFRYRWYWWKKDSSSNMDKSCILGCHFGLTTHYVCIQDNSVLFFARYPLQGVQKKDYTQNTAGIG